MALPNNTPNILKEKLNLAIQKTFNKAVAEQQEQFIMPKDKGLPIPAGASLDKELFELGIKASTSAFVQRRSKIPFDFFNYLFETFNDMCVDSKKYKGYRILAVDGTTINLAYNPNTETYVENGQNKGFNQMHANVLFDVLNKTYVHAELQPQPQTDEIGALLLMLQWHEFKEKTLIVGDRGYESYNTFGYFFHKENVDFLIRVKQEISAMKPFRNLPMEEFDCNITFTVTTTQKNVDKENGYIHIFTKKKDNKIYSNKTHLRRWDFASPYTMTVRVVRFQLDTGEYETLATSLPKSFTLEEIKEMYHARWGIETGFRELKYGLGLVNLHCKKDDFARQEIYSAIIMSNFVSHIVNEIILQDKQKQKYEHAVNMKKATHLCRKFFRTANADEKQLIKDIASYTVPIRPGRKDQRKIKTKSFVGFTYRV